MAALMRLCKMFWPNFVRWTLSVHMCFFYGVIGVN